MTELKKSDEPCPHCYFDASTHTNRVKHEAAHLKREADALSPMLLSLFFAIVFLIIAIATWVDHSTVPAIFFAVLTVICLFTCGALAWRPFSEQKNRKQLTYWRLRTGQDTQIHVTLGKPTYDPVSKQGHPHELMPSNFAVELCGGTDYPDVLHSFMITRTWTIARTRIPGFVCLIDLDPALVVPREDLYAARELFTIGPLPLDAAFDILEVTAGFGRWPKNAMPALIEETGRIEGTRGWTLLELTDFHVAETRKFREKLREGEQRESGLQSDLRQRELVLLHLLRKMTRIRDYAAATKPKRGVGSRGRLSKVHPDVARFNDVNVLVGEITTDVNETLKLAPYLAEEVTVSSVANLTTIDQLNRSMAA